MHRPPLLAPPLGAILAGGRSTRFGGLPKGLQPLGGRRVVDRVADALRGTARELVIVTRDPEASLWLENTRVVPDRFEIRSALTGIHAALDAAGPEGSAIVVAWDMPFVTSAVVRLLAEEAQAHACDAVVPIGPRGPEPCCAWYRGSASTVAANLIERGELRLGAFVDALPVVRRLPAAALARRAGVDAANLFRNLNTPQDLAEAERLIAAH